MKTSLVTLAAAVLAFGFAADTAEAANGHVRARTPGGVAAAGSYNGNSYARARGVHTNSDGGTTTASGGTVKLANGAYGSRASTTTYGSDGSVSHSGQAAAYGAKGSATTSSSYNRSADGTASGSRTTQVTSSATGNTYTGATRYANGAVSHTGTCHDASGAAIACPY